MKPHPRIRKTIKWGGPALLAVLAAVWAASGWRWVMYLGTRTNVGVQRGLAWFGWLRAEETGGPGEWMVVLPPLAPSWAWWFDLHSNSVTTAIWIPIWVPAAVVAGVRLRQTRVTRPTSSARIAAD